MDDNGKGPGRPKEFQSEPRSMSFLLESHDHAWLTKKAREMGVSRGELVRRAVQHYRLYLLEQS